MNDLANSKNFEELCNNTEERLKKELYSSPVNYKEIIIPYDINYYAKLCKLGFWVIDCEENSVSVSSKHNCIKDTSYERSYIRGYIHRFFLEKFNYLLTCNGYQICVHDHCCNVDNRSETGYVITNNQIITDRMYGVLVEYTLTYDNLGQPKIEPKQYIKYDRYSLDKLKKYFNNNQIYEQLYDEYVEITILDKNFDYNKDFENDVEKWLQSASHNPEDWSEQLEQYRVNMLAKKAERKQQLMDFWNSRSTENHNK